MNKLVIALYAVAIRLWSKGYRFWLHTFKGCLAEDGKISQKPHPLKS